jgi:GntR family transcriptional regulator/MocR family aminotransferase
MMDLAIALDNTLAVPLHRQLYDELRQAILFGRLESGQQMPSTRMLAQSLGISRATVLLSYEQLLSEGYLKTVPASGTFVSHQLPDDLLQSGSIQPNEQAARQPVQLSTYGANLAETEPLIPLRSESPINFSCYGRPALDEFPLKLWRRLLSRACRLQPDMLDYATNTQGYRPLREAIARYITRSRAVRCDADRIIIVNGSQQALDLVARLLLERGDLVAIENPGYLDARRTFLAQAARLLPIPVDQSGIVVDRLAASTTAKLKFVYVTPSHQFPTGVVLSLPRRLALLAWAQQTGALIVEDDYDSEYRYGERPIPALQGLTASDSVIYIGTFSKVIFPALRLGYLVLPQNLVSVFAGAKWLSDRQSSILEQCALTEFINEGHLESPVRRMRMLYDQRRQTLVQALTRYLGSVTILGENTGMHLMVKFHTNLSDEQVVLQAAQVGVGLISADPYYLGASGKGEFILGYADLSQEKIQEGVRRLAQFLLK